MTDDQPLYNSRIIQIFVSLLKKRYPRVDLGALLEHAEIEPYQVGDEGHWFSQRQVNRFHDRLTELLGTDPAREAGRFAASGESLGNMTRYVLGLLGPAHAFFAINKESAKMTRSASYSSQRIADNAVELVVRPHPGVEERSFQCENRIGFFEAVLMIFNYSVPVIEHPECLFQGGECCRYIVTWQRSSYARIRTLRNYLLPPLGLAVILAQFYLPCLPEGLALFGLTFFASSWAAERLEKRDLARSLAHLKESSDRDLEQIADNYNNARIVNEVGQAISKQSEIDEVLENLIRVLEHRLGYDRCLILLADARRSQLSFRTGFGFDPEQLEELRRASFSLADAGSTSFFVRAFSDQRAIFVDDSLRERPADPAAPGQGLGQAFICCAIVCEGESLGVLAVDNVRSRRRLVQRDMSLLNGIAPVIGMTLRNAMHLDRDRRMEQQVRQSQKLEAVGKLAGGIAHDFNNLLTAMVGFVTLSQMELPDEHPVQALLGNVLKAAERATSLTQGLLSFSRKQVSYPQPVELNGVVDNIRDLLRRLVPPAVQLEVSLAGERLQVVADASQLDQILINLVTNARDAIEGAGRIDISSSQVELCADFVARHGFGAPGSYVLLSVTDTGCGMDDATRAQALEPFFTTKEVGKGTGLGLAIVYGIVKQHDGFLEIQSQPGAGTTCNIYLPLLCQSALVAPTLAVPPPCFAGAETILVAHAAAEPRRIAAQTLRQSGYRVIEARDRQDALAQLTGAGGDIDLVILDPPAGEAGDALDQMARASARTKLLFTGAQAQGRRSLTCAGAGFLEDAASPQTLVKKVRALLAA